MNLELSFEQRLLRDSAAGVLVRAGSLGAARTALDEGRSPDHWALAEEAGWTVLMAPGSDAGSGGLFEAMLILEQCGVVLASPGLIGHLPANSLLSGPPEARGLVPELGRMAIAFAGPGGSAADVRASADGDHARVDGQLDWVVDGVAARTLLVATELAGRPVVLVVDAAADGVTVEDVSRYDLTRPLAAVRLDGAPARILDVQRPHVARARYVQQALLGAEGLGTATAALDMATAYAKDRHTFTRPIGSYQGVKHRLVEMLRLVELARSLTYRAAWAQDSDTLHELAVSACAARFAGDRASFYAADQNLYIHGAIGATWEHDGHLLFRRAQVSRRLLGGSDAATREVVELMMRPRDPGSDEELQLAVTE